MVGRGGGTGGARGMERVLWGHRGSTVAALVLYSQGNNILFFLTKSTGIAHRNITVVPLNATEVSRSLSLIKIY